MKKILDYAALGGPAAAAVTLVGWLISGMLPLPMGPGESSADVVSFFTDEPNRVMAGFVVSSIGVVLMVPMLALISVHLLRVEGRVPLMAFTQLLAAAVTVVINLFPQLIFAVAAFRADRDPGDIVLLNDLAWLLLFTGIAPFMIQNIAIAVAVLPGPLRDVPPVDRVPQPARRIRLHPRRVGLLLQVRPVRLERGVRVLAGTDGVLRVPRGHVRRVPPGQCWAGRGDRGPPAGADCCGSGMTESSTFLWVTQEERDPSLQAEGRARRRDVAGLPGEVGLWVFVLGDMTIFGAFFTVFAWELRDDRSTFSLAAAALHQPIGVLNTLLLLISSYAVVVALHAHRRSVPGLRRRALLAALVCGSAFLVSKAVEYSLEISAGHTPASNDFFTFYFVMTGVHGLHVVIGMVLLTLWVRRSGRSGAAPPSRAFSEGAAVYWHMVDLLWIVIFGLLYLGAGA